MIDTDILNLRHTKTRCSKRKLTKEIRDMHDVDAGKRQCPVRILRDVSGNMRWRTRKECDGIGFRRSILRHSVKENGGFSVGVSDSEVGRVIDPEEEADRLSVPTDWRRPPLLFLFPSLPRSGTPSVGCTIDSREHDLRVTCATERSTDQKLITA